MNYTVGEAVGGLLKFGPCAQLPTGRNRAIIKRGKDGKMKFYKQTKSGLRLLKPQPKFGKERP